VYGTGGVAYGSVRATLLNSICCTDETHSRVGYTVGGGFETAFNTNWSVKLEYLYVNFGTKHNYTTAVAAIAENVFLDAHIVRAGLNYRFNWGSPVVARY
jgi:outer membrane immunogenic protein